jgi:hypothetical protein
MLIVAPTKQQLKLAASDAIRRAPTGRMLLRGSSVLWLCGSV